jgi:hypothetical protein
MLKPYSETRGRGHQRLVIEFSRAAGKRVGSKRQSYFPIMGPMAVFHRTGFRRWSRNASLGDVLKDLHLQTDTAVE